MSRDRLEIPPVELEPSVYEARCAEAEERILDHEDVSGLVGQWAITDWRG